MASKFRAATDGRVIVAAFLLSLTLVGAVAWYSNEAWSASLNAYQWVSHTHEVLSHLERAFSDIKDVQIAERGYLLTGQESHLETKPAVESAIQQEIGTLQVLTADNALQQANIGELKKIIATRLKLLDDAILMRRQGHAGEALSAIKNGADFKATDAIRALIRQMTREEDRLLQLRSIRLTEEARNYRHAAIWIVAVHILLLLIVAGLFWRLSRIHSLLTVCAWSKTVQYEDEWITYEQYLRRHFGVETSHGISPKELQKFENLIEAEIRKAGE